jgi:hypothetical protein
MATNRIFKFMLFCVICMASFQSSHAIITIKVSDTTGSPVANALVTLTNERDTTRTHYSNTDRSGLCTIDFAALAVNEQLPKPFSLGQNYPNPFNPTTVIPFSLAHAGEVKLVIYNALGQNVRTLVNGWMTAGQHTVVWNGMDKNGLGIGSGVYIYVLSSGKERLSQKMLLMDGQSPDASVGVSRQNGKLLKPAEDKYRIQIRGLDIQTYEAAGNSFPDGALYEYTVTRNLDPENIVFAGAGETGTPVSDGQRTAAFTGITQKLNTFKDQPESTLPEQLARFLADQPEIEISGYGAGGVWARFTDGRLIVFDSNVEAEDFAPAKASPAPESANQSAPAAVRRPASGASWSDIPESSNIGLYKGHDEATGWLTNIKMFVEDPKDEKGDPIYSYKTGEIKNASVEALMSLPSDLAVFALHTHGSDMALNRNLERVYSLYTTSPVTVTNEFQYSSMLNAGELAYYHPFFTIKSILDVLTFSDQFYHYAITAKFVDSYWGKTRRFESAQTFVYFNTCSGASAKAQPMIDAIFSGGASLYAGWTYRSMHQDGPATASYIFDRLLGANLNPQTMSDAHRPFSWDKLHDEMISLGLGKTYDDKYGKDQQGDAQYSWLIFKPAPNCPFKLLAPSIKFMDVDEKTETDEEPELTIFGTFGDTEGEVFIKKESVSGASPLSVKEWTKEKIICYLQKDDYGDVSVKVNGNRSNLRPLSRWKGKVDFTVIPNPSVPNQTACTLQDKVTWDLKLIRADVALFRDKPEEKPASREVRFLPTRESTTEYTSSGSQVVQTKDGPVTVFSWSGNGTIKINDSREESTSRLAYTFDTGTKIGKMDMYFLGKIGTKIIASNNNQTSSNQQINTGLSMLVGLYDEASSPNYKIYCPFDDSWSILAGEKKITVLQYPGVAGLANAPAQVKWDAMTVTNPPLEDQYHGK